MTERPTPLAVILVEDSEHDAALAIVELKRAGFDVLARRVQTRDEMAAALAERTWDVVLCDHRLPQFNSVAALDVLVASNCLIPLIIVSGAIGEEAAAGAIRNGAADFVSKDHLDRLGATVRTQLGEAALRAAQLHAEAQFRSAFDDAPFGSALISLDRKPGLIVRANRALCETTGHTDEELIGLQIQRLVHPSERRRFARGLRPLLEGRKNTFRTETRLVDAVGKTAWFLVSLSYVHAAGGRDAVAQIIDIDARKQAEEVLRLAHSQALEASRMKSEFVVNMSHELRTPLNGVTGLAELLVDTPLSADQSAYVAGIRTSGRALAGVIGGILDLAKIEAGTLTVDPADFEPAALVSDVCALVASAVDAKGVQLIATVDPPVPDVVHADAGRVHQVLTNLVGNAVKFTDQGTIKVKVTVEPGGRGQQLRFDVMDSGAGLEASARPFEAFWQSESSPSRAHAGTGLGLAIAARMIELLGGSIDFESAPGSGTHFWFALPYEDAHEPRAVGAHLVGVRALVVDGPPGTTSCTQSHLKALGARVSAVADTEAALTELRAAAKCGDPYQLTVLDATRTALGSDALASAISADPRLCSTRLLVLTPTTPGPGGSAHGLADATLATPVARSRLASEAARVVARQARPGRRESRPQASPRRGQQAARDRGERVRNSGPGRAGKVAGACGRVLLVEDDPVNRLYAVDLLERDGWQVDVATTGAEAVAPAAVGGYDVVLMDCQMPDVDGYTATELIRRLETPERRTPIIALTAHATTEDRQRCTVAGMDDYLAKPFTVAQINDVLERAVGASNAPPRASSPPAPARTGTRAARSPLVDLSRLAQADPPVRTQLIDLFLEHARERIVQLAAAADSGDAESVRAVAHALRGASATVGAERMARACDRLSQAVTSGRPTVMRARQSDLENALTLTEAALKKAAANV